MTAGDSGLPEPLLDELASLHADGDGEAALADLCRRHPEHAVRLRAVFEQAQALAGDASPALPERIGPYRILRRLGRGGMGIVFLAEQDTPVRQQVALKVVRAFDDERLLARFAQERQALALMNHDGIARIHHSDTTPDGRPYFAMEYVQGVPLTDYCQRNRVPLHTRLRLVQQVCAALTHAHQKGVVHRDLKPDNILVVDVGVEPHVKIIDFGLAKLTALLTSAGPATQFGHALGTLQYMAPEQAGVTQADVDTRADIWSVGVILHELLVGRPPWSRQQLVAAGLDGVGRLLRESDPARPSTGLVDPELVGPIAAALGMSVAGLRRILRSDLDWVVLKAMAPDRSRRYDTASALAMDLQRFLDHEPLLAGPPGALYRLRKLGRRYRGPLGAVAAVVATAVVGAAIAIDRAVVAEANLAARQEQILAGTVATLCSRAQDLAWSVAAPLPADALASWVADARELQPELEQCRAGLAALRARAIVPMPAELQAERERFPGFGELQWLRNTLSSESLPEDSTRRIEARIAELEREFERRLEPRFAVPEDAAGWAALRSRENRLALLFEPDRGRLRVMVERLATVRRLAAGAQAWATAWRSVLGTADRQEAALLQRCQAIAWLWPLGRDPRSGRFEFCASNTGEVPVRDAAGRLVMGPESGLVFVLLPGGSFAMGSTLVGEGPDADPDATQDEAPPQTVDLAPFLIGKHEVHQGAWLRFTGENPANYKPSLFGLPPPAGQEWMAAVDLLHPVEQVSQEQCVAVLDEFGLCLPTEAQWEYAARGGTTSIRWMTDDPATMAAGMNVADESAAAAKMPWRKFEAWEDRFVVHAPIDALAANPFGLHHVLGNVWEWCADAYVEYARHFPVRRGDGLSAGFGVARSVRGGNYAFAASSARCANRNSFHPATRAGDVGVRAAIVLP